MATLTKFGIGFLDTQISRRRRQHVKRKHRPVTYETYMTTITWLGTMTLSGAFPMKGLLSWHKIRINWIYPVLTGDSLFGMRWHDTNDVRYYNSLLTVILIHMNPSAKPFFLDVYKWPPLQLVDQPKQNIQELSNETFDLKIYISILWLILWLRMIGLKNGPMDTWIPKNSRIFYSQSGTIMPRVFLSHADLTVEAEVDPSAVRRATWL